MEASATLFEIDVYWMLMKEWEGRDGFYLPIHLLSYGGMGHDLRKWSSTPIPLEQNVPTYKWLYIDDEYAGWNTVKKGQLIFLITKMKWHA